MDAQLKLQAKRKLAVILKTKASFDQNVSVGDMTEAHTTTNMNKRGQWSTPKVVLAVDKDARTITVPAKGGTRATVSSEDIRLALLPDSFAVAVQHAIDNVDETIDLALPATDYAEDNVANSDALQIEDVQHHEDADFSGSGKHQAVEQCCQNPPSGAVNRCERVLMYWPLDEIYYAGTVKHLHQGGQITVLYDDGGKERVHFDDEIWNMKTLPMR